MMGYRGEDLDLRTPHTWSATPADLTGAGELRGRPASYGAGRGGPIPVDETVLACCNHAFDAAMLNRSGDVRIEHLLHALTRIDAAAEALEARGLRVTALRRDTATAIGDIPIGLPNGKGSPRRSEALEDLLRLAADVGARRNSPATVDDLLHVMIDLEPGLPGLALVSRNLARQSSFGEAPVRGAYAPEPRVSDYPESYRARPAGASYYLGDAPRAARSDFHGTATDNIQNTRIDALEQMVRALGNDLAGERKALAGLMQDVQREVVMHRDETSRLSGGIQGVDSLIERRLGELSRPWLQMNDRLQGLEHAMTSVRAGTGGDTGPMNDRIAALEQAVQAALNETTRQSITLIDKVKSIESALVQRPAVIDGKVDLGPLLQRLDMIEEAVLSREATTREINDRLRGQDDQLAMERATLREAQDKILNEMKSLSGVIDREGNETASAVLESLTARLKGLAGVIEDRHSDTAQALAGNAQSIAGLIERLTTAEAASRESTDRAAALQQTYAQELLEVHDALMKLNTNQHMIAGSIESWREDTAGTLSLIGSRIETVEREAAKPISMLESLSATVDRMHRVTVERYYRRSRFWYWLFGTDDWIASSWPAHTPRLADDARLGRTTAEVKA